jgi:hypothetical protein
VSHLALSLDSPRWAELTQAYGTAEDVPRLLEALACIGREEARAEVWFALWRTLHRPEEAFTASFAAVPHLLEIGRTFALRERAEAIHLVARIEIARSAGRSAPVPADVVEGYAAAVDGLASHADASVGEPWPADVAQILSAALLVGKRQPELARALLEVGRTLTCPTCGTELDAIAPRD